MIPTDPARERADSGPLIRTRADSGLSPIMATDHCLRFMAGVH